VWGSQTTSGTVVHIAAASRAIRSVVSVTVADWRAPASHFISSLAAQAGCQPVGPPDLTL
jgi:hypothetical protein